MADSYEDLQREIDALSADVGHPAYLLYAMGLRLGTLDYTGLQTDCLLDGPDDKKVDFLHLDFDNGIATIAQAYRAQDWSRSDPPASKAADLNTAINWLIESDLSSIPRESVRAAAEQLRDALSEREITRLEVFFVHNLPCSPAVDAELATVQRATQQLLEGFGGEGGIIPPDCVAQQVSRETVVDVDGISENCNAIVIDPEVLRLFLGGLFDLAIDVARGLPAAKVIADVRTR